MNLIAKVPFAHSDDRDCSLVVYDKPDNREGSISEFVVWTESSTGDHYHGDYFPYDRDDDESRESARRKAIERWFKKVAHEYAFALVDGI